MLREMIYARALLGLTGTSARHVDTSWEEDAAAARSRPGRPFLPGPMTSHAAGRLEAMMRALASRFRWGV